MKSDNSNTTFEDIIIAALRVGNTGSFPPFKIFQAAIGDLANGYPGEKNFLLTVADEKYYCLCIEAIKGVGEGGRAGIGPASLYLQNGLAVDKAWADYITGAMVNAFAVFKFGMKVQIVDTTEDRVKSVKDVDDDAPATQKDGNYHNQQRRDKKGIIIIAIAILAAIAVAFLLFGNRGEEPEPEPEPDTTAAETAAEKEEPEEEGIIYDNVDHNLPITSLRMEFDSSKKIGDGIISTDVVMLLSNHTGHDVTGFAFRAYNMDGDKSEIKNKDKNCKSGAPFYAEGYLPDGGNGVMVCKMTISKKAFKKLNPKKNGHRLKPKCIQLSKAYVFRGETDYSQPTGRLLGPYKDKTAKVKYYSVEIDNDNDSPVHEGARIVAMRRDDEDSTSIRNRSAKGSVDQEIPAGSQGFVIKRTFNNSELEQWPAKDYEVYVIDNEYSDGSHYYDAYLEEYGQQ